VRSDGSIYFSDPWYGRMPVYGVERPRQLGFQLGLADGPVSAARFGRVVGENTEDHTESKDSERKSLTYSHSLLHSE
jgi:hypothetical protein